MSKFFPIRCSKCIWLISLILFVALAVFFGWQYFSSRAEQTSLDQQFSADYEHDGQMIAESGIPPDWVLGPRGVGFQVVSSTSGQSDSVKEGWLTYRTRLSVDKMAQLYKTYFDSKNWEYYPPTVTSSYEAVPRSNMSLDVSFTPNTAGRGSFTTLRFTQNIFIPTSSLPAK